MARCEGWAGVWNGKTPAGCRRYQTEVRMEWIWSSHSACSGFIRTERRAVTVGLSRRMVVGRFWKKEAGSSARARGRFLEAAAVKMRRDSAEISLKDGAALEAPDLAD